MTKIEIDDKFTKENGLPDLLRGLLYLPSGFKKERENSLLVYLHGAGERGCDISHITRHAIPKLIEEGREIGAVVYCPQCPADFVWGNIVEKVKKSIDIIANLYCADMSKISITGSSMGGYGTSEMVMCYRNFFSRAAVVSGGGVPFRAQNMKGTKIRFYHGADDNLVTPEESRRVFDVAAANGCDCEYFLIGGKGHNEAIEYVYEKTDVTEWLLAGKREDFTRVPEFLEELF